MSGKLNQAQLHAVFSKAQSLLIVAGPGTGKTHTLTQRIVEQLKTLPAGEKILAVTFTHKADEEMRSRLERQVKDSARHVFIGTFHQMCLMILRERMNCQVDVASQEISLKIVRSLWPDLSKRECKKCLERISLWKAVEFESEMPVEARDFTQALRAQNMYDFDDLLLEVMRALEQDRGLREALQKTYTHICVDEYQDINPVQRRLLTLLAGEFNMITAIGDPNQAIYGFRGSDVGFFHSFEKDFSGAVVLPLAENYRSPRNLVSASGQMMQTDAHAAVPVQVAGIYDEGLLTVHSAVTDKAEAEYVVHTIEQLVGGTSMFSRDSGRVKTDQDGQISFGDVAVLYRLKSQAREIEKAFARSGIPYFIVGSDEPGEDLEDDLFAQRQIDHDIVGEKVLLMTLHAAKGLEFPCVFICGCEDGLIPLDLFDRQCDLKEERRLLYVGMTRAKKRLYLVHAQKRILYGKRLSLEPSRFLADIEESLKQYSQSKFKKKQSAPDDGQMTLF